MVSTPIVETRAGKVAGVVEGDITVFGGIPYAKPPFGDRLWRLPEPAEPWDDVLDCSAFGPICPQPTLQMGAVGGEPETQAKDCLRLNVWVPGRAEIPQAGRTYP